MRIVCENIVCVTTVVVARCVRPAMKNAQDVPLVDEVGSILCRIFGQSLFLCSTFCFILSGVFLFLVLAVSFSQK